MRTSRDKFDFTVMSDLSMFGYRFKKISTTIGIKIGLHNTSDDFGSKKTNGPILRVVPLSGNLTFFVPFQHSHADHAST